MAEKLDRAKSGKWKFDLNFKFMKDDDVKLKVCRDGAVAEIEALLKLVPDSMKDDLEICRTYFKNARSTAAYDRAMNRLYDVADVFCIWVRTF